MTIRVLLGATTAMVSSALQGALAECEDIELIQPAATETADLADIDVVLLHRATMRDCPPALRAIADSKQIGVVAIGEDGLGGSLYRVASERWRFGAGGRQGLADAIRAVAEGG